MQVQDKIELNPILASRFVELWYKLLHIVQNPNFPLIQELSLLSLDQSTQTLRSVNVSL